MGIKINKTAIMQEKAQYFAQHCGHKVAIQGSEYEINEATIADIREDYLLLTPLSQITDEDAIEVAKITGLRFKDALEFGRKLVYALFEARLSVGNIRTLQFITIIDYLRSKGYALPYKGYTVEQLIEKGWLKLKEV